MNVKRLGSVLVVATAFLVSATGSVAAAGALTNTAEHINQLSDLLLAVAIPLTLIVEGILGYAVWKFRKSDEAKPTVENRRLELTWTVATAVILVFVGVAAYGAMASPGVTTTEQSAQQTIANEDPVVVDVHGYQWAWRMHYPNGDFNTTNELVLPADRTVVLRLYSDDVIHAVHVPALSLKKDNIPGQTNYIQTTINSNAVREEPYKLYCAEFCGAGHSEMLADVYVKSPADYQEWVEQQSSSGNDTSSNSTSTNSSSSLAAPAPAV
ncbi:cytochrome c oxidase subunit II [Halocalculus aciditolerans]|uniref:cytochrome-c oxidase n=1 Tax=Halocalculus aciditolerans TaxID=1383812 RepID=A0A830FCJ8_9EURY|nr:cytochrome c oxidase subunit II [Halocalculus aciditolerans]GGL61435.1 cytochrome c oxidase subunit II [Halocalculus aciditolerans]